MCQESIGQEVGGAGYCSMLKSSGSNHSHAARPAAMKRSSSRLPPQTGHTGWKHSSGS